MPNRVIQSFLDNAIDAELRMFGKDIVYGVNLATELD
jgi:hypothetical protein